MVRLLALILLAAATLSAQAPPPLTAIRPGTRVMLDGHNAYPYNGKYADRIDRALAGGLPVAIEQDLVWRPATATTPARSIVSHGEPFDGTEPSMKTYFFERIRPLVEDALRNGDQTHWPLITLNLDLKSNEPEHHRALWALLGEYESWLTTAERVADGRVVAPLDVKPLLVLTGESTEQLTSFHDTLPIGSRLRLFGAMPMTPPAISGVSEEMAALRFWEAMPTSTFPRATNYRRWWNANWRVVETGGQSQAADWTATDEARLRTLVRKAHDAGLWMRLWTLNGLPATESDSYGWSPGYNFGSLAAVRQRWRAAIAAGVDFVATDQYETFTAMMADMGRRPIASRAIVIEGTLTAADRLTWIERPFDVPPGTARIEVDTSYADRDQGTAIEFGLYDPHRFRGASRTSKTAFFVSRSLATPSYLTGDLPPGQWRLLMGIPSIRDGAASTYRVVVRLTPEGAAEMTPLAVPSAVATTGPRWYQGDLHTHTMHSDGFRCADGRGGEQGCAAHLIASAAQQRGLDFVAITDHNTTSHHADLIGIQARHERLLVLRGQELTTFYGHANAFGTSDILDFRIGPLPVGGRHSPSAKAAGPQPSGITRPPVTAATVFADARRRGAVVSLNHPGRETGERCTGCGWNAPDTDYALIDAIEVVNGRVVSGPTAGEPFWHARLNEGHRLTGIGGSDDHGASTQAGAAVGTPTTVIYADALTESALLAGLRAGHVFIKTRGPEGPDVRFAAPAQNATMGDVAVAGPTPQPVQFRAEIRGALGQHVDVIHNGVVTDAVRGPLTSNDAVVEFLMTISRGDWVRINVRDGAGLTAIANPIYWR